MYLGSPPCMGSHHVFGCLRCILNYRGHCSHDCRWCWTIVAILGPRLRNSNVWSSVWGLLFRTNSVMGRLWDDHFRHLGHPPKCYRVQDLVLLISPRVDDILGSFWWKIIKQITNNHVFQQKWYKQKKPPAGKLATEVRIGDAPKPAFSIKSINKSKKSGNQSQINP